MELPPGEVTYFLRKLSGGSHEAIDELLPLVYKELKRIAASQLGTERIGHTLQPTALVHEAFLRMLPNTEESWQNRTHFVRVAAQAMRRVLIDYARSRLTTKRGGSLRKVSLDQALTLSTDAPEVFLALDTALRQLEELDPRQSYIVELKYFGGLTLDEIATATNLSTTTVKRELSTALAWLSVELGTAK